MFPLKMAGIVDLHCIIIFFLTFIFFFFIAFSVSFPYRTSVSCSSENDLLHVSDMETEHGQLEMYGSS